MSKALLDTNILVYSKDKSSFYHQASLELFTSNYELYTTSKNLTEYFSVVTKSESPLLSPLEALQDINEFSANINIIYPSSSSNKILFELIKKYQPRGIKIHDFEIAAITISHGIPFIYTVDQNDFKSIKEVEVLGPPNYN